MLYTLRMLVNTLAKQVQGLYHKYGPTFCHFDFWPKHEVRRP